MKIAIPVVNGKLSPHFGHSEGFAFYEVEKSSKKILGYKIIEAPPHEPGLLPKWLASHGADIIIAGGMGKRAQDLFSSNNIEVVVGAQGSDTKQIVLAYLEGNLETSQNLCDH